MNINLMGMLVARVASLKIIKWLTKALSTDGTRPVLSYIHKVAGRMEATNGFFLLAANVSQADPEDLVFMNLPEKTDKDNFLFVVHHRTSPVSLVEINDPPEYKSDRDFASIIPKQPPTFEIAVNPKFLADALSGFKQTVVLRFYDATSPMEVVGKAGALLEVDLYAYIMPMALNYGGAKDCTRFTWRMGVPYNGDAPEKPKEAPKTQEVPKEVQSGDSKSNP